MSDEQRTDIWDRQGNGTPETEFAHAPESTTPLGSEPMQDDKPSTQTTETHALTEQERECLNAIGHAFNLFSALPVIHPADLPETVRDIHNLQNRVLSRVGLRSMRGANV